MCIRDRYSSERLVVVVLAWIHTMLRAYTAVINRDSPLPAIPAAYVLYRKAALSLSIERSQDGVTRIDEFVFRIKNTPHPSFKVK